MSERRGYDESDENDGNDEIAGSRLPEIRPALSRAEWAGVLANRDQLSAIREQLLDTPFSAHAVAALLLYDEPFGFTAQDVEDETEVAAYCAAMAREQAAAGHTATANTFRMLGERHTVRAAKIAALLPPASSEGQA